MKIIRVATHTVIFMFPLLAYASNVVPTPEIVSENAGLFQWILGLTILACLYLVSRMIKTSEENNDRQWTAIGDLKKGFKDMHDEFLVIKTEHKIHHKENKDD